MGWGALKNGDLLQKAEGQFEAFIPTDQNLKYQQRVIGRKLAIFVLPANDWPMIRAKGVEIAARVATLKPGDFDELDWSSP
jgi:hypothetical protein